MSASDSDSDYIVTDSSTQEPGRDATPAPNSSLRPSRNRRQPDRYGSDTYNPSQPLPGENDTTANWGPGWSKEAWASDCHSESNE